MSQKKALPDGEVRDYCAETTRRTVNRAGPIAQQGVDEWVASWWRSWIRQVIEGSFETDVEAFENYRSVFRRGKGSLPRFIWHYHALDIRNARRGPPAL